MRLLIAFAAMALAAQITPVAAQQPAPIKLDASEVYRHKPTGLSIPTTLDGLQRTLAGAYVPDLDEALGFDNPTNTETLSVYVFRNVSGSVPIWFDRIDWVATHRDIYGGLTPLHQPRPFAPNGQGNADGLIGVYSVGKGPYVSTGVAFMPLGSDWYVSLRYSSKTLDPATLETHLRAVAAALAWPKRIEPQAAVTPIEDCTTPLALSGKAKPVDQDKAVGSSLLFGALLSSADDETKHKIDKDDPPSAPVIWCRDIAASASLQTAGVYRPVGTSDRYLIAYQDAGRGVMVQPDTLSALLLGTKSSAQSWSITEYNIGSATSFIPRDRLPAPDQAQAIVTTEGYASKVATWGKNRNIEINSNVLK